MNFLSYEDFKKLPEYQTFINENPEVGYLKVQAFTAYQAIPIDNVEILITKLINNNQVLFFRGYTNESGIIENIELPAPTTEHDVELFETPKYTEYELTAIHEGFETIKKYKIEIFGEIKIVQYVKMKNDLEEPPINESVL